MINPVSGHPPSSSGCFQAIEIDVFCISNTLIGPRGLEGFSIKKNYNNMSKILVLSCLFTVFK